jgi:hypothetical protein
VHPSKLTVGQKSQQLENGTDYREHSFTSHIWGWSNKAIQGIQIIPKFFTIIGQLFIVVIFFFLSSAFQVKRVSGLESNFSFQYQK